jgi:hypothetical protein
VSCTCETYRIIAPDGKALEGVSKLDPDCRKHGLPAPRSKHPTEFDWWPAHHPLRRYAGMTREPQPRIRWSDQSSSYETVMEDHWRLERPREVEARLLREAELGIPIPALRPLPERRNCPPRFGQR